MALMTNNRGSEILLAPMQQLTEAVDEEDDWTGITDAKMRRRRQNRLHQRAWRRRKAQAKEVSSHVDNSFAIPRYAAASRENYHNPQSNTPRLLAIRPLIPYTTPDNPFPFPPNTIIFPLPHDHLLTLTHYNVLRAILSNHHILSLLHTFPYECSAALSVPPLPFPSSLPSSLHPTELQLSVPHEYFIDMLPLAQLRDNFIKVMYLGEENEEGKVFDNDEFCDDIVGGLFEGREEEELSGVLVWDTPWCADGWELTPSFIDKWKYMFKGCGEMIKATNKWRERRGEERIVVEL